MITIYHDNCLKKMKELESGSINLILTDPPFNTGHEIVYRDTSYDDDLEHDTYIEMMKHVLQEAYRILANNGTIYVMLDYHSVHYVKVEMDKIFGRDNFLGEIIWAYDFGGRTKKFFPNKHMTFLVYAKDIDDYTFNYDDIDREPYMAPSLCGEEKAETGKKPNSVWWNSIVGTNSKERNIGAYATKKPLKLFDRIIRASSNAGDTVLDMFAGSGTTGHASEQNGRNSIMIDENQEAINAMKERYIAYGLNYKIE